jgi:hypothetical protein
MSADVRDSCATSTDGGLVTGGGSGQAIEFVVHPISRPRQQVSIPVKHH